MLSPAIVGASAVSGAGLIAWWTVAGERGVHARASRNLRLGLDPSVGIARSAIATSQSAEPIGRRVATRVRRLTPAGVADKLSLRIARAGMASKWTLDRTLAAKALLGLVGLFLAVMLIPSGNPLGVFYGFVLPPLLFFGPDMILNHKAKERQRHIRFDLPDTLDQVTVCVEAGLGFEAAMARAAKTGDGPLAEELVRTLQDVQLGVPRKDAMRGLADRNDVDELRQFVTAILQAEGYGVPIARVLRVHASELREKRRQEAEERAMKVSIKLLFPLVTCILPVTFIVMVGPAIFQLVDSLGSRGG